MKKNKRSLTNDSFPDNIPCPNPAANAMQNYTQQYEYDQLGNILKLQNIGAWTRNYIYDTATNKLLRHSGTTDEYSYDAHGNMLSMPHLSAMAWDYQDQLHSATNGTFTSYYNYDAEGNRTRKVVEKGNIVETRYYINGYEVYRKEVNNVLDFERITLNISDDEKTFVRIEQKTGENEVIRYQYDNHLGSACLELDETGQIISYEEYHPFGTTSYRSGRTEIEVSLKRYKYCGKERDEETGLYYYGMRYYAAWLCRFVSVDPLQFKYPYYTPYQYAGNKPITFIDLDGGEEMPNPYDMFVRELKALWDATIGSLFPSKKENEPDKKMNEQKQVEQKKEKIEIAGNNNIQQTTELKQSNTTITIPDNIKFVGNAKAEHVSEYSRNLISKVANEVGITAKITSTKRTPDEQINVMYNNLEQFGIKSQLEIYGTAGDQVIKMYETAIKEGKNEAEIKDVMKEKAIEVNFISPHASPNYNKLNAIDIGYSSFSSGTTRKEFIKKMEESGVRVINEPKNKAIHLEIKQNQTKN